MILEEGKARVYRQFRGERRKIVIISIYALGCLA